MFCGFSVKVYILNCLGWWPSLVGENYVVLVVGYLEKTMIFVVFGRFGIW